MTTISPKQIKIGTRFRRDYNIDDLVGSIKRFGILQPLVVTDDLTLIAGGRRLTAALALNLEQVPIILRSECDEITLREIELEENIQRKDLTWQERARLVAEIDNLKRSKYGSAYGRRMDGWSMLQTAQSLDLSRASVSRDLVVARAMEIIPELAQEPDRKAAFIKLDRIIANLERELMIRDQLTTLSDNFHHGNALELIKTLPTNSIDLILTDPPYGTDIDNQYRTHFTDTQQTSLDLLTAIAPELRRVLKENGHMYMFCGIRENLIEKTRQVLLKADFDVDEIPLVWIKSTMGLCDFSRRFAPMWEPVLFVGSRDRTFPCKHANVLNFSSTPIPERVNIAQKPLELLKYLIEASTIEQEVVFDPFAGSGSTLRAAQQLNRKFIGFEQSVEQWRYGILWLADGATPPVPSIPDDLSDLLEEINDDD